MEIITILFCTGIIVGILFLLTKTIILPLYDKISYFFKKLKKNNNQYNKTNTFTSEEPHISFYKDDSFKFNKKLKSYNKYESKSLLTKNEMYFYNVISENFKEYLIQPQVNLATIIEKHKDYPTQYQNELFRNIDFGIFDKKTTQCLLLIEINDNTHTQKNRIVRDIKVKEICEDAGLKLITFYTKFENRPEYIVKRIKNELKR